MLSHEAQELVLFIENDGDLYRQQNQPILRNLANKAAQGKYDHQKAIKLWMYLMDNGAKKYAKEFATPGEWNKIFSVAARKEAAKAFADDFEANWKAGEYRYYLTKVSAKKLAGGSRNRSGGSVNDRLFIATMAGGIAYTDRTKEEHGDYKRLAFLPYDTLKLEMRKNVPADLKAAIVKHAASIQEKSGQQYQVSSSGQTTLLGRNNRSGSTKPKWGSDRDRYHGNPNARRNRSGSVPNTHAWADGFGTWHVRVSRGAASPLIAARKVLRHEITSRQGDVADFVWKKPVRVQSLDDAESVVYREGDGSHVKRNSNQRNAKTPNQRNRAGHTKATKRYVVDQVQGHFWNQVGAFYSKKDALEMQKHLAGKTKITHTWPSGHNYEPIWK